MVLHTNTLSLYMLQRPMFLKICLVLNYMCICFHACMCACELEHLNAGTQGGLDVPSPAEAEMMGHLT